MKEVVDIHQLLRKQQSYINAILKLQAKLLKTQALITEELYKEIKEEVYGTQTSNNFTAGQIRKRS